jgi:hypothetical protein
VAEVVAAAWSFGDASEEEKRAARAVIEPATSLLTNGDEKRAAISDAKFNLPTHVDENGWPDTFTEREHGLYGGDGRGDDPLTADFWNHLGEVVEGGPQRLDSRAGRRFAAALRATMNGNDTR